MADGTADLDASDMDSQESYLSSLYYEFIRPEWEFFTVVDAFVQYMDSMAADDPTDLNVSNHIYSIGEVIKNSSHEILNYISNEYFIDYYKVHKTDIDRLTQAFHVQLKLNRKNQISIHPFTPDEKITIITNEGKRRLIVGSNVPISHLPDVPVLETPPVNTESTPKESDIPRDATPAVPPKPKNYTIFFELSEDYKELLEFFTKHCPEVKAKTTGEYIRLNTDSPENYRKIQTELDNRKIPFRTLDPRSERPRKVLLRGLPSSTPTVDIEQALKALNLEPLSIAHLKSRKASTKGTPLPLFVVTLRATANFEEVYKMDTINFLKIKIEKFKAQPYRQCYQCQAYGHSSFSCNLRVKCLKCAEAHNSKDCTIKDKALLKCANCGGNHPANYKGCPKHPANRNLPSTNTGVKPTNSLQKSKNSTQPQQVRSFTTPTINPWSALAGKEDMDEGVEVQTPPTTAGSSNHSPPKSSLPKQPKASKAQQNSKLPPPKEN